MNMQMMNVLFDEQPARAVTPLAEMINDIETESFEVTPLMPYESEDDMDVDDRRHQKMKV